MMPSAETDTSSVITAATTVTAKPIAPTGRRPSPFGLVLSPETALHQSIVSMADQAVASATNFLTGVIIARACSKEELGLYMLGFSLILLMTDFQTSLITTPYMVYAPRLKGRAHALYTGSTLIHQSTFCVITMLGVACGAIVVTQRTWPPGPGAGLVGIGSGNRFDHASRTCSSREFRAPEAQDRIIIRYLHCGRSNQWPARSRPLPFVVRESRLLGGWIGLRDCSCRVALVGRRVL
jgi:hypothetical protein